MSSQNTHPAWPVRSPPDAADSEFDPLLTEPFARMWELPVADEAGARSLRSRLLGRVAASRAAEGVMFTARQRRLPGKALAAGVLAQTLYESQVGQALRPGEPLRARLIELAAGAGLAPALLDTPARLQARRREWLVLSGSVQCGGEVLRPRDYHVTPAGHDTPVWAAPQGALLFLRESELAGADGELPFTVRDADADWPDFAAGIQRRVLWQRDGQAALLYCAQPGARVPQHSHCHDEECLMLQGELFLDDLLLQAGDYQLAPCGTGHRITETDTGAVIYAHGDLDLRFVA